MIENNRPGLRPGAILRELAEPTGPLQPGARVGRYIVVAPLGQGRYGVTYRARDPRRHVDVAIKEFLPITVARRQARCVVTPLSEHTLPLFQWGRAAFIAEANKLAALGLANTPAISVREVFEDNGTAYMVMGLVVGESLQARLNRERRLSRQAIDRLLPPLLEGLAAVHGAGLLHADIKPAHILTDAVGRPSLVDFGAARLALADRVRAETGDVTPGYAAPELMASSPQGTWTDVYGLAATLYHCIAGVAPLSARERLVRDALVPASDIGRRGYGRELLAAIDAGLKPVAGERLPTIDAWRAMLDDSSPRADSVAAVIPRTIQPTAQASAARVVVVPRRRRATSLAAVAGALVATVIGVLPLIGLLTDVPKGVTRSTLADVQATTMSPPARSAEQATRKADEDRQPEVATRERQAASEAGRQVEAARRAAAEMERQQAAAHAKRQAEEEAARRAADLERQQAEALEARRRQAEEAARHVADARRRADEEAALRAAAEKAAADKVAEEKAAADRAVTEAARRAEEQARLQAEAQRQAQVEAAVRAAAQAAHEASEKARLKAETERYAETEARAIDADLAVRDKSAAEAQLKEEREARRRTAEAALRSALEAARREADSWPKAEFEARRLGEAAEASLQLPELERKRVQAALTAAGHAIGATTGFFGPHTRAMIRAWQKQHGIPETGFITGLQLTALHMQVAPDLRSDPPSAGQGAAPGAPKVDPRQAEADEAALGLSEADRKRAQMALTALGHEVAPISGFFGPRTRAMIAAWQKKQGLPETGFLAATQWTALQQQATAATVKRDEAHRAGADGPGVVVDQRQAEASEAALGLSEADRKRAQMALTALGHEVAPISGFFGPRTRAMITAWQKKQGLPETGFLSAAEWQALQRQAALAKHDAERRRLDGDQPRADINRWQAEAEEAALGLSEEDRRRVQVALSSLGHEIGATTGFIGPRTRAMITAWQRQQGLPETGFLSAAQWRALQQQAAPALAKYDASPR